MPVDEIDEASEERVLARVADRLECLHRRAVVGAEVLDERLGRAEAEREGALFAGEAFDLVAEQVAHVGLRSPEEGRSDAGHGRHIRRDDLEHLADEPVRGPGREADLAAGAADACELGRRLAMVRREHRAEDGKDGVEALVRKRDRFRVALEQLDRHSLRLGADAAALEQCRDVVDADDVAAAPCCGNRSVAAAAGDVEDEPIRLQVDRVAENVGDGLDQGRHCVEVAARPHLLLAPFHVRQIGGAGFGNRHLQALPGQHDWLRRK